jgi:hypothetical protein
VRRLVLALGIPLVVAPGADAAVRLHAGPVASLSLEGVQAAVRAPDANTIALVDARSGRELRRVPLRGANVAHVSGPRLATITLVPPDSHRLLDDSTLRLAPVRRPSATTAIDRADAQDGRVWSSLFGRGGLVVAVRDVFEPSPATPDCEFGGECEWVHRGTDGFVYGAGTATRRRLPNGRVLDADASRVLVLVGRELVTVNARGTIVRRTTLPASLREVRYGRLGGDGRALLVATADYGDAAILVRPGAAPWTGSLAADAPPAFDGRLIAWGTGPRVWLRDAARPARRVLVARCPVAVSAVAVSDGRVAWACRGRGAGAWADTVR